MLGLGFATLWVLTYVILARYGALALPDSLAREMSLPTYLVFVQLTTVLLGALGLRLLIRQRLHESLLPLADSSPKRSLRLVLSACLLAPALYAVAHALGMYFAFDTLIAELAQKGRAAVQAQTGELGRSAAKDSLWLIVPFTVLVAPFGEELVFRGGLYGSLHSLVRARVSRKSAVDSPSPGSSEEIPGLSRRRNGIPAELRNFLAEHGWAVLISTAVFGALHADTPGGMGILRVVSATSLGLACGLARAFGGSLVFPLALHAFYNLVSLGTMRGWWVTPAWPSRFALPTLLIPIGIAGLFALSLGYWLTRPTRDAGPSV